ncbi:AfsR/SARP family transcriptional regulator [Marinitenerispora sediminis]|uniref:SARP family transcriptional regulator n=1 Tax=Marinitenerispora sediminis TaxID=1931232 RepID=A0A368T8I2_9ACTN|nr:BTAD domain-containing putative transcriptional regulator [Marinitenerispora sediminis]RCV54700.1 SARP family transcriptional regulator [Marinitenerispora sediminis]RCV59451.1 SARP family transcriptional regulator [Marinitenerispora sediminis]RCV60388.1 SARP family transcriptional regulator [Marinitenerispora sediminis]
MSRPELRFEILGPLRVQVDGEGAELSAVKPRMLLATLLLQANRMVPLDTIVETLWPERPPASAVANVRTYASALRAALGGSDRIRAGSAGYAIRVEPAELDLHVFNDLVRQAEAARERAHHETALGLLHRAMSRWRGRPLEDLPASPMWEGAVGRMVERRVAVAEERGALQLSLGQHAAAISPLRALLAEHPFRERLWLQLILALYGSGRRAEALRAFADVRRLLVEELGVEPCAELRQVHEAVLDGDPAATTITAALATVLPTALPPVCQLPPDLPDFQGRAELVHGLLRLGADGQRGPGVTVVAGPPGVGKSTLVTHVAHALRDRFPDGQLYLDLKGTTPEPTAPAEALAEVLRALGVVGRTIPAGLPGRTAMYRSRLAGRRMLLVLDDAGDTEQILPLLPSTPECGVLVTSRRRLTDLPGAQLVELDVLAPDAATALLAAIAGPERVAQEPEAAAAIVESCGGLPLALRLAGAKLAGRYGWPLRVLAERLTDESRRLGVLGGVRASFEASLHSLLPPAATVFRLLGTLEEMPATPSWTIGALLDRPAADDVLDTLVDANLIRPVGVDELGQPRYAMHDLLRLYAREVATAPGDTEHRRRAVRRVVGGWLSLTDMANTGLPVNPFIPRLTTAPRWQVEPAARQRLADRPRAWFDAERHSLVAAVGQAASAGLPASAWELAVSLVPYFDLRAHYDDWQRTHRVALEATRTAGLRRGEAALLRGLGQLHIYQDEFDEAVRAFRRSQELFAAEGDEHGEAIATSGLATVARFRGRYSEALEDYYRALAGFLSVGDQHGEAVARTAIGRVWRALEDRDQALVWFTAALQLTQVIGDRHREAHVLHEIGLLHRDDRAPGIAMARFRAALVIFEEIGDSEGVAEALGDIGRLTSDR